MPSPELQSGVSVRVRRIELGHPFRKPEPLRESGRQETLTYSDVAAARVEVRGLRAGAFPHAVDALWKRPR